MSESSILLKSDIKFFIKNFLKKTLGIQIKKVRKEDSRIKSKVSVSAIKKLIREKGFAVSDGQASWFYTAYERGDLDPLTNFAMAFLEKNVDKKAPVLITGCGTGIMAFHLADVGFTNVAGFDYLHECVEVAQQVSTMGNYNITFYQDDGFNPKDTGQKYDAITALHWVFSAWMGNYGNKKLPAEKVASADFREELLTDFLKKYSALLNKNGVLILELTDAVSDYRIAADHYMGDYSKEIYPIRHSPEQVEKCAVLAGLTVNSKNLSVLYGHQPRTQYILRKL
jgi:SAM-dependent methyltransferase